MAEPGCRCAQCWGLSEFMEQLTGKTYGLPRANGCSGSQVVLRVLTTGPEPPSNVVDLTAPACDQSMTCACEACAAERSARVRRGVRPSEPIPVRRAA